MNSLFDQDNKIFSAMAEIGLEDVRKEEERGNRQNRISSVEVSGEKRLTLWGGAVFIAESEGLTGGDALDKASFTYLDELYGAVKKGTLQIVSRHSQRRINKTSDPEDILVSTEGEILAWAKQEWPLLQVLAMPAGRPRQQSPGERNKMLGVLLAMAIDKYGYNPSAARNSATGTKGNSIKASLEKIGLSIDADTVKKYLKESYEIHSDSIESKK